MIAASGFGLWALVIQMLTQQLIITIGCWVEHPWMPPFHATFSSAKKLIRFGGNLALSNLIGTLSRESYTLIVGRMFSTEITGHYYFARKINSLIQQQLIEPVQEASFPSLSQKQTDLPAVLAVIRKMSQLTTFLIAPMAIAIAVLAEPFIMVSVGEKWRPAAGYLQILCFLALLYPLHSICINVMKITGNGFLILKWNIIRNFLAISLLVVSAPYGVKAIILSQITASVIILVPNAYHNRKLIGYRYSDQFGDVVANFLLAIFAGAVTFLLLGQFHSYVTKLLAGLGIYAALYLSVSKVFGNKSFTFLLQLGIKSAGRNKG